MTATTASLFTDEMIEAVVTIEIEQGRGANDAELLVIAGGDADLAAALREEITAADEAADYYDNVIRPYAKHGDL